MTPPIKYQNHIMPATSSLKSILNRQVDVPYGELHGEVGFTERESKQCGVEVLSVSTVVNSCNDRTFQYGRKQQSSPRAEKFRPLSSVAILNMYHVDRLRVYEYVLFLLCVWELCCASTDSVREIDLGLALPTMRF